MRKATIARRRLWGRSALIVKSDLWPSGNHSWWSLTSRTMGSGSTQSIALVESWMRPNTRAGPIYVDGAGRLMMKLRGNRSSPASLCDLSGSMKMFANGVAV